MNELASATATHSIVIERMMPHPPEKIWRAVTQGPLIEEWLMKNDFKPVVGHKFNLRSYPMPGWNGVTDCEVLIVEPNKRLRFGRRGGERIEDRRHLDAEARQRRHAPTHGAIRLPRARRALLSGRRFWLEEDGRNPRTGDCGTRLTRIG